MGTKEKYLFKSELLVSEYFFFFSFFLFFFYTSTFKDYLLIRWTEIVHFTAFVFPNDCTVFTVHPYCRVSPSFRSSTNTFNLDLCVLLGSITQDEKSPRVMQLFIITLSEAIAVLSESLCICSDINFTSGFRVSPEHSISFRLGMFLKSLEYNPENNTPTNIRNNTETNKKKKKRQTNKQKKSECKFSENKSSVKISKFIQISQRFVHLSSLGKKLFKGFLNRIFC